MRSGSNGSGLEHTRISLAQLVLLHLTHRVTGQCIDHVNHPGPFEPGKIFAHGFVDCVEVKRDSAFADQHCHHAFTKVGMRRADDRGFADSGQRVEEQFNFLGIDIVPARDNQILAAPNDLNLAIPVDEGQITRDKEPVLAQFFAGLFGHVPVALKDVGSAHFEYANLALR